MDSFTNFRQISPAVQNHLKRVYLTLCCAFVASATGAYLHMIWNIGGFLTTLGFIGVIICFDSTKTISTFFLCAFLGGASVSPLFKFAFNIDPSFLIAAYVEIAVAFICFSVAAMLERRRDYLYLVALISSAIFTFVSLQFTSSTFGGSASIFKSVLYFLVLIFLGYIVVETQVIIKKAERGDVDYKQHSVFFFTDLLSAFLW